MSVPDYSFWKLLQPVPGPVGTMIARVPFPDLSDRQLAAIDMDGRRHYLIAISDDAEAVFDVRSRGIKVNTEGLRIRRGTEDGGITRYIDILCTDPLLYDGFDLIGYQIAEALSHEEIAEAEAVKVVLSRWRYFWSTASRSLLSNNEIVGLFSEVRFISHWLLPYMDSRTAILSWRGPLGGRHDFQFEGKSVEVKGTTSIHGKRHWIHGLDQLQPPENGRLFLFSLQIREEVSASESLPGIIQDCRTILKENPDAMSLFEDLLAEAGYYQFHAAEYSHIHFRVVDEAMYRVEGTFPRITGNAFRELSITGITGIDYEISLDGFDDYIVAKKPIAGIL